MNEPSYTILGRTRYKIVYYNSTLIIILVIESIEKKL